MLDIPGSGHWASIRKSSKKEVGVEQTVRLQDNATPVACRPRRLSKNAEREVKKELDTLFEQGLIRYSNSPWASPVVCARRLES